MLVIDSYKSLKLYKMSLRIRNLGEWVSIKPIPKRWDKAWWLWLCCGYWFFMRSFLKKKERETSPYYNCLGLTSWECTTQDPNPDPLFVRWTGVIGVQMASCKKVLRTNTTQIRPHGHEATSSYFVIFLMKFCTIYNAKAQESSMSWLSKLLAQSIDDSLKE